MSVENMSDGGLQSTFQQHPHPSSSLHPHSLMPQNHNHMPPFSMPSNISIPSNSEQAVPHSTSQFIRNESDLNRVPLHSTQDVQMVSSPHAQSPLDPREQQQQQQQQQQPQLQIHETTSTLSTERNHMCSTCNKGFKSKQQLAQHSLVHSGIRKHVCSFCDKGFKQLCHLQQHIRIHTGEKPYKCTFQGCERAFAQMANLHHHMRNHDDHVRKAASKQFHCMVCHRAYTNESSLKNHTLKMHVHVRPLEPTHQDVLYKPGKQHKEDTQNYSSPHTIDLTKDRDEAKSPEEHPSYSHEQRDKISVPVSYLNDPRPSSFVRYMDEHLRLSQTLANEPPSGLHVSSSMLSHPILTDLHRQSVREPSSHVHSSVRESNSHVHSSVREPNSHVHSSVREPSSHVHSSVRESNSHVHSSVRESNSHVHSNVRESSSHVHSSLREPSSHVHSSVREQSSENISSSKEIQQSSQQHSDSIVSQHKDTHVPSVNIAHYNTPPMQFGGLSPVSLPMRMSLPTRLQSFPNLPVTIGSTKDNQGRVISPENPFPRLVAPVVSVHLSGNASSPHHSQRMTMNI